MARFFSTATPQYLQDFIYQPDWNFLEASLSKRQTDFDNVGKAASLLEGQLTVPYLPFDKGKVENAQQYFNNEIDSITNDLYNNKISELEAQKRIGLLSRNIQDELSTGLLSSVVGRYNNFNYLDELNKETFKNSPEDANMFKNYFYNKLEADTYNDPYTVFSPTRMVNLPNLTDEEYRKIWEKAAANLQTRFSKDGAYKIELEELNPNDLMEEMLNIYMKDPKVSAYLSQQAMLGDRRYFDIDSEGNISEKPFVNYIDSKGNKISFEEYNKLMNEYDKLSDSEKQKRGLPAKEKLNMDNPFISIASGLADIYGYSKEKWFESGYYLENLKHRHKMAQIRAKGDEDRKTNKAKHDLENKEEEPPQTLDGYTTVNNRDETLRGDQNLLWNNFDMSMDKIGELNPAQQEAYMRIVNSVKTANITKDDIIENANKLFSSNPIPKDILKNNEKFVNELITKMGDAVIKNPSVDFTNPDNLVNLVLKDVKVPFNVGADKINKWKQTRLNVNDMKEMLKQGLAKSVAANYGSVLNKRAKNYYKEYSETTSSTSENPVAGLSSKGMKDIKRMIQQEGSLETPQFTYYDASTGKEISSKEFKDLGLNKVQDNQITGYVGQTNYGENGIEIIANGKRIIMTENKNNSNIVNANQRLLASFGVDSENFSNPNHPNILENRVPFIKRAKRAFFNPVKSVQTDSRGNKIYIETAPETLYVNNTAIPISLKRVTDSTGNSTYTIKYNSKQGATEITPQSFGKGVNGQVARDAANFINEANRSGRLKSTADVGVVLQQLQNGLYGGK